MSDIPGTDHPEPAHFTVSAGGEIDTTDTAADGEELEGTTGGLA